MRTIILLLLTTLMAGCVARIGPVVLGVGQVESCSGEYRYDDTTGRWQCMGDYVSGAAISDTAGRAIGVVGDAAVRAGSALGGMPPPSPRVLDSCQ